MFRMGGKTHCGDCDWKSEGNNVMGTGAKHHHATGHKVFVEVYWGHIYESARKVGTLAGSDPGRLREADRE